MDRSQQYRSVIHQVLNDYYRLYSQSESPNLETMMLNDEGQDQYLLLRMGWRSVVGDFGVTGAIVMG